MTKKELVEELRGTVEGLTKKATEKLANKMFDVIKETVAKGEKVAIAGFGTFDSQEVPERSGVSKLHGVEKEWTKEAHKKPVFKASKNFKEAVK